MAVAPTPQENVILRDNQTAISNLHCTKHDSPDPATKNDFSRDYEDHLNIVTYFKIPVVCDFDLRKKNHSPDSCDLSALDASYEPNN